nr:hypothetical protein [Tanacetum cinerariifolium]
MRLKTDIKPKEATFQVVLDALALTLLYCSFLITTDVPAIYMHEFWAIVSIHKSSIRFSINKKKVSLDVEIFREILQICHIIPGQEFKYLPLEHDILSFIRDLGHTRDITYLTDKPIQATKGTRIKIKAKVAKSDKKKHPAKKPKAKGLVALSNVALTEAEQLKMATKRSNKDFHISHTSGSSDEVDTQSKVPDEQQQKTSGTDEGTDDADYNDDDRDDNDESDDERTESESDVIPNLNKTNVEHDEEKEEYDDEFNLEEDENINEEEDDEVTKELYKDVNVFLGNKDADMTYADQGAIEKKNASRLSRFKQEEEDAHVTLTLVLDTTKTEAAIPKITSSFATPTPPPPPFFNTLQQEATPTPTPTTSEAPTSFTSLLNFTFVFKFNERVTNLEKDLSEIKQVDQYAQALSSIPAIVDCYMDNKLREEINKAIKAYNFNCREEAQAEKREYIELTESTVKTIIKEEVNDQLPQILPQVISDVVTPIIEKNVTDSLETVVLTRSSSQPQSLYEAAATLFEFELTKILIDKKEKNKSFNVGDYKRELYDALIKSFNTDKDILESYGDVFSLKRSRNERDKDRDPFAGSGRGTKRRKSSKDDVSSRDSKSKERSLQVPLKTPPNLDISLPTSLPMQRSQVILKRRQVDFRPPQTWISQVAHAEEPPSSFDELNDTLFDLSTFVINWLNIPYLTQEILVGPAFNLFKGTYKSNTKLEYHLEKCSKATAERFDWHNPENKPYPFDLRKPLSFIQDYRGHQVILKDYFINKDLEYLKGGDLSRKYSTLVTKTKAATYELKWMRTWFSNYGVPRRIITVTRLKIMKKYDYGHLEEIEVRRDDQDLYTFNEGDFKRLRLKDIEDILLLLVQQRLTNLTIDEH